MSNYKSFIASTIKEAGKIAAKNFRVPQKISWKEGKQIVTETDLKIEKLIVSNIRNKFPEHNIISEESPGIKNQSNYTWFIDPIDGTASYSKGIPFFCIAIALAEGNKIIKSAVYDPIHKELFYAEKGKGTYLNDRKIKSSASEKLSQAFIAFGIWPKAKYNLIEVRNKIEPMIYVGANSMSVCLTSCYVAAGRIDGVIFSGDKPWDVAPQGLICPEAGVKITGLDGKKWRPEDMVKASVVARPKLHKELMKFVKMYYKE